MAQISQTKNTALMIFLSWLLGLYGCGINKNDFDSAENGSDLKMQSPQNYHINYKLKACALKQILENARGGASNELAFSSNDIQNALCVVNYESHFNPIVVGKNDTSSDWGVFQINDYYNILSPGNKTNCGKMRPNIAQFAQNIYLNSQCAVEIYHARNKTFGAWATWKAYCINPAYRRQVTCDDVDENQLKTAFDAKYLQDPTALLAGGTTPAPIFPGKQNPTAQNPGSIMCQIADGTKQRVNQWMKGCFENNNNDAANCTNWCIGSCNTNLEECQKAASEL